VNVFEEFLNLVIPARCVLCKALGSPICPSCESQNFSSERGVKRFSLNGFAVCLYTEEIALLIHEFKENSQTALTKSMARNMAGLVPKECEVLVPMPSKQSSFENRGFNPAKLLASAVARSIAKNENRLIEVFDILSLNKSVSDQAALSGHDRRTNLIGAMSVNRNLPIGGPVQPRVWLVDDIVTTGATLREAARCLDEAGIKVAGFLAFAETLPRNRQNSHAKSV